MIMAGGTGGHIFPALAVARALQSRGWRVVWLGAQGRMEADLVPRYGFELALLPVGGVRGRGLARKLVQPFEQARALYLAWRFMHRQNPSVVIGFGGFTAFAGGIAARLSGRPLLVHEQNSVAGTTNRLLAKIARRVLTGFPQAFPGLGTLVGNPVRDDITALPPPAVRFIGRQGPLKLLVIGGSQGAAVLNEVVPAALAQFSSAERPCVIHQAGAKHIDALRAHYAAAGVAGECAPFINDMAHAYADADLVICRSGALTIAELSVAGVASILVPYPHAVDDHQTGNAAYLSDFGAARLVQQDALTADWLAAQLRSLDRPQLLAMASAARSRALPNATADVVKIVEDCAP